MSAPTREQAIASAAEIALEAIIRIETECLVAAASALEERAA